MLKAVKIMQCTVKNCRPIILSLVYQEISVKMALTNVVVTIEEAVHSSDHVLSSILHVEGALNNLEITSNSNTLDRTRTDRRTIATNSRICDCESIKEMARGTRQGGICISPLSAIL